MKLDACALGEDVGHAHRTRLVTQPRNCHQVLNLGGQGTEAIHHVVGGGGEGVVVARLGKLAVDLQAQTLRVDVALWDVGVHGQVHADFLRALVCGVDGLTAHEPLEGLHGFADQPDVHVEADARDVAGLLRAEHVARATHFQVLLRHGHAGAQVVVLGDGGKAVVGGLCERLVFGVQEVRVRALAGAPHASAQLV